MLPWASAIPMKHGIIDQTRDDASISTKVGSRAYCLYPSLVIPKSFLQLIAVEAEAIRQPGRDRAKHRDGKTSPFIDVHARLPGLRFRSEIKRRIAQAVDERQMKSRYGRICDHVRSLATARGQKLLPLGACPYVSVFCVPVSVSILHTFSIISKPLCTSICDCVAGQQFAPASYPTDVEGLNWSMPIIDFHDEGV